VWECSKWNENRREWECVKGGDISNEIRKMEGRKRVSEYTDHQRNDELVGWAKERGMIKSSCVNVLT
jgi:hypothetical protein